MFMASHNPYEDNGLKIFGPDGYKLSDELELSIEQEILAPAPSTGVSPDKIGKATRIDDARGRYIEYAKQSVGPGDLAAMTKLKHTHFGDTIAAPAEATGVARQNDHPRSRVSATMA